MTTIPQNDITSLPLFISLIAGMLVIGAIAFLRFRQK
jgi:hypothetical protein